MGHYRIRLKVRKKKIKRQASVSKKLSVNNITIPKADLNNKNFKEIEQYGHKMIVNTDIQDNGNGEKWKTVKNSIKIFLTKKEIYKLHKKYLEYFKMGKADFMERMTKHKLAKWEKKHPRPIKENQNPPDMFEEQFVKPWEKERDLALERIRDFVVSVYDKLEVVGNKIHNKKLKGNTVALIKDVDQKGHNINYPNLKETDKLYINATKEAQKAMNKDPEIIDCHLLDHKKKDKRPLIHAKRKGMQNLKTRKKLKFAS